MATKKAAGFIIYRKLNEKIEYLLLQASYGTNHWTSPKGHLDDGESALDAAFRETEEEAGLKRNDLKLIDENNFKIELNYVANNKPKVVWYWLAELINPNKEVKLSDEHITYKWLNIDDALEIVGYEDTKHAFKNADSYIKSKK